MPEYKTLLFEIGTEELPPKSLTRLAGALQSELLKQLEKAGLVESGVNSQVYATPRRLAVSVDKVAEKQPDRVVERRGPALALAFDSDGEPTQAALGFARSVGKDVNELERLETGKGEWLFGKIHEQGKYLKIILPGLIDLALKALPIARRMRWGDLEAEFIRPVHWLVLLYGAEVIDTEILSVKTGRHTRGHRFHAPGEIELSEARHYESVLLQQGRVIVDFDERRKCIVEGINKLELGNHAQAVIDTELLDEVTGLVEYPVALKGSIESQFMDLPKEVLVSSMQNHQKYFPVTGAQTQLLPAFVTICNILSQNESRVIHGNERVLRARLSDARFFWEQDKSTRLENRLESLKEILFHNKLGSLADKAARVRKLGIGLASILGGDAVSIERGAALCKADLMTDMVGEFPELQGVMGKYYALNDGESPDVARAIEEHYLPRFAGDSIPSSATGRIIALADKLDTICGVFAAGEVPTGDKDPYGLRRSALGILRIQIESDLELDMRQAISDALKGYSHLNPREDCQNEIYRFIFERLKQYYQSQGFNARLYQSVASARPDSPLDFDRRLRAISSFAEVESAQSLIEANKRISNLLSKVTVKPAQIEESLLLEVEEQQLYKQLKAVIDQSAPFIEDKNYTGMLDTMVRLKQPVDDFFDNVMVMDEDTVKRDNRIALLNQVNLLLGRVANISCLR